MEYRLHDILVGSGDFDGELEFYLVYKITPKGAKVIKLKKSKYAKNVLPKNCSADYDDPEYFVRYDEDKNLLYSKKTGGLVMYKQYR